MRDPRIDFRSRGLAGVLAFLIPGAGHFYQGRHLKGGIFAICILSTFFAGLVLGEGQPVYCQVIHSGNGGMTSTQLDSGRHLKERSLGYYLQVFVGIPAMPALVQAWRYEGIENTPNRPELPLAGTFEGNVLGVERDGSHRSQKIEGELRLEQASGQNVTGTFTGNTIDREPVNLALSGSAKNNTFKIGRPIFGSPRREVHCNIASDESGMQRHLFGTIERPFLNWFQAPRDYEELDRMHNRLSQKFDIACVFTWVAGLLNIMAIWDAYDGPAYGYGDEDDESGTGNKD